ncbi:MAG: hypothetical protein R8G66_23180 [Cytophagales bacterium]|nr:hypothetical protein [Cytophagales bacterium]
MISVRLVFNMLILGPNEVIAQLDNYPFITLEARDWLIEKNFDTDYYRGNDSLVNIYLTKAVNNRKDPFTAFLIDLNGGTEDEVSYRNLQLATQRRYDLLLKGQLFEGVETFRGRDQSEWYRKENFYVEYYDGQSSEINALLDEAYRWRNKSNNQWYVAAGTNIGGIGMILMGGFFAAFGSYDASQGWLMAGTVVHLSSYAFAASASSSKSKARGFLNKASRSWFRKLNKKQASK